VRDLITHVADGIACALRESNTDAEQRRSASLQQLEQRRRVVVNRLDRGYDDNAAMNSATD